MSRGWRVVATILGLVLAAYFLWFATKALDFDKLAHVLAAPRVLAAILLAAALYALIIPITAWAWKKLLETQNELWVVSILARILGLAQLAKYIPGNIAQHATRAVLAMRAGMGARTFVVVVGQETVLTVAASLLVGLVMMLQSGAVGGMRQLTSPMQQGFTVFVVGLTIGVLLLASVKLHPRDLAGHRSKVLRLLGRIGGLPGPAAVTMTMLAYSLNYLIVGMALWLVAIAMGAPSSLGYSLITATFSLSWVLGFLAPGAPAGLGAREAIMILLLQDAAPADVLVLFVLLARLTTMFGDAICFLVASLWRAEHS